MEGDEHRLWREGARLHRRPQGSDGARPQGVDGSARRAEASPSANDIILWLRRQGFMFAKASWLERIHHNSGKPIYAESVGHAPRREPRTPRPVRAPAAPPPAQAAASVASAATAPVEVETAPALVEVSLSAPMSAPALAPLAVSPPVTVPAAGELEPLLAKAKAYRPLAHHLIAQIKGVRPTASLVPAGKLPRDCRPGGVRPPRRRLQGAAAASWRLASMASTRSFSRARREAALARGTRSPT